MKRSFFIMLFVLVAIVAATGIVIITYNAPNDENSDAIKVSRAQTVWQLLSQSKTLMAAGRYQEAERVLARLLRMEPDSIVAKRLYARAKYELGEFSEAADLFRLLIARDPQDAISRNNLGQSLIRMQWIEAGIKELLNARAMAPGSLYIDENLAQAYLALGDVEHAAKYRFSAEMIRMTEKIQVEPPDAIRTTAPPAPADEPREEMKHE